MVGITGDWIEVQESPGRTTLNHSTNGVVVSGVATGVQGGHSATPDSVKFAKIGKKREKIRKKRKNRGEKAKIGKVLSLCPS